MSSTDFERLGANAAAKRLSKALREVFDPGPTNGWQISERDRHEALGLVTAERLRKSRARLHIIEGLLDALEKWAELSAAVFAAANRQAAREVLHAPPFHLSDVQAEHVLDMPVGRRTRLGRQDLADEADRLRQDIAALMREP
jgi:DNA gyrase/topoisomerase IV subunit A